IHTHVWLDSFIRKAASTAPVRAVTWPARVASQNSVEELMQTYELLLPGKQVTPLMFSQVSVDADLIAGNQYVSKYAESHDFPSLMVTRPEQSAAEFEEGIERGGFLGCKVY